MPLRIQPVLCWLLSAALACMAGPLPAASRPSLPSAAEIAALPPDGGASWNRLVFEKSPYLLQHAANPVDWYPWGEEAFSRAASQDLPVFLSIGYSTCHWCHVMEHESFEDPEVAALMNRTFVCVKVDREERPDVDQVYMRFAQLLGSRGGWPLTVVMTPEKVPFFIGTYFPKTSLSGRMGMMDLVPRLAEAWSGDRARVRETTARLLATRQEDTDIAGELPGEETLQAAHSSLAGRYDKEEGGFGRAPKFPVPHNLRFLLRHWARTGDVQALAMVENTLTRMRHGGIWDHLGNGFHRYSTDRFWLVPHFEKMLYDQALLTMAYVETWQATGNPLYEQTAREILGYVTRDMTSPEGGFYSAEDADSEGHEGKFYLWTPEEVVGVLGEEEGALFQRVYDVTAEGNFRDPHTGTRASIPRLKRSLAEAAADLGTDPDALEERMQRARAALFRAREARVHPIKDDKILTDWNGLMIAAFSLAGRALDDPEYGQAARRAADFVLDELQDADGRLLKRHRQGDAGLPATLEDYAFFLWGLVELYQTVFDPRYLEEASRLADDMILHFQDEKDGTLYMTADDGEPLPVRPKESYDGALPSGNSVAALALVQLARLTGRPDLEARAAGIPTSFSPALRRSPSSHTQMMMAVDFLAGPSFEVVVAGEPGREDTRRMLRALSRPFLPNKVALLRPAGPSGERIARIAEYTKDQAPIDGLATAYVCQSFACLLPTTDVDAMLASLGVKGN